MNTVAKTRAFYWPQAGDVIWLDLNPTVGHEQAGRRPCLVLSEHQFAEQTGYAIVCPITKRVRNTGFEVSFNGSHAAGVILTHQIKSIDLAARFAKYIETVPPHILQTCRDYVQVLIGNV